MDSTRSVCIAALLPVEKARVSAAAPAVPLVACACCQGLPMGMRPHAPGRLGQGCKGSRYVQGGIEVAVDTFLQQHGGPALREPAIADYVQVRLLLCLCSNLLQ